jgi:DNA-directed RNA polymerase beta subunit
MLSNHHDPSPLGHDTAEINPSNRQEGGVPNNNINYRLRDSLIQDVVTREGYSQTLREALQIMSTLSHGPRVVIPPEQLNLALCRAGLLAPAVANDPNEE